MAHQSEAVWWASKTSKSPCAQGIAFAEQYGAFEALVEALKSPLGCSYVRWYAAHAIPAIAPLQGWNSWREWYDAIHVYFHTEVPFGPTWEEDRRFALTWPAAIKIADRLHETHGATGAEHRLTTDNHWPNHREEQTLRVLHFRKAVNK